MRLVYLPVNMAWVFLFGDTPSRLGDYEMFYYSRSEAVVAARHFGLTVARNGRVS